MCFLERLKYKKSKLEKWLQAEVWHFKMFFNLSTFERRKSENWIGCCQLCQALQANFSAEQQQQERKRHIRYQLAELQKGPNLTLRGQNKTRILTAHLHQSLRAGKRENSHEGTGIKAKTTAVWSIDSFQNLTWWGSCSLESRPERWWRKWWRTEPGSRGTSCRSRPCADTDRRLPWSYRPRPHSCS